MNRRELLASVGAAGTGMVAGCSGPLPHVGTVVLNGIFVTNSTDESHEVRLVVADDDSTYLDRRVSVEFGTTLGCDWPATPGQYVVAAQYDGEWVRTEFPGDADEDCHIVEFAIGPPGGWESKLWPCRADHGARCGHDGHGTPGDHRSRR